MSVVRDLRAVIELACLTEDRSDNEQRALLRTAMRADNEANKLTVTNGRDRTEPAWRLLSLVYSTRELVDDQKAVSLKPIEEERWEKRVKGWGNAL
jgi:hypothetical protein